MRGATICSGIGAPEQAMPGWDWCWSAEIEPFPSAVLAYHNPLSVNLGDMLAPDFVSRAAAVALPDVLVAGTPCQSFSVAGMRGSMSDARGNLTLVLVRIFHAINALRSASGIGGCTLVWENVPGVLNTKDNAFGCFLGALVGADDALAAPPGGSWPSAGMVAGPLQRACWRVLDAQYFGLAQRRQRVFVVSCPADGGDPSQILFERKGMRGNTAAGEVARESVAGSLSARTKGGGGLGTDFECQGGLVAFGGNNSAGPIDVATAVNAHGGPHGRMDFESETFVAQAFRTSGNCGAWSTGDRVDMLSTGTDPSSHLIGFSCKDHGADAGDISPTLRSMGHSSSHANGGGQVAVAMNLRGRDGGAMPELADVASMRSASGGSSRSYVAGMSVRRLTPVECERLQGFPDGYTMFEGYDSNRTGKWGGNRGVTDGPRYRALGNSMAVPVLRWILSRIESQSHPSLLRATQQ